MGLWDTRRGLLGRVGTGGPCPSQLAQGGLDPHPHLGSSASFEKPRCDPRFIQIRTIKAIKCTEVLGGGGNYYQAELLLQSIKLTQKD